MRKNNVMGVVFSSINEDLLPELTINRSILTNFLIFELIFFSLLSQKLGSLLLTQ